MVRGIYCQPIRNYVLLRAKQCTGERFRRLRPDPGGRGGAGGQEAAWAQPNRVLQLVPFQQIDVYAKESGFVNQLNVDYGTRVTKGDVMAVLEIPELQEQLNEDQADIKDAVGQVDRTKEELSRVQAQQNVAHLEYTRLNQVAQNKPGLVAQQEVDDRQGTDLAAQAQVSATQATLQSAQSQLQRAQAKLQHDQVLYDYAKITAPFSGVVTQRYANLGTLMQSGVNTSTQALPLVQLSEDDKFRLVIPVPESYVPSIHLGDPVQVQVPALHRTFPARWLASRWMWPTIRARCTPRSTYQIHPEFWCRASTRRRL